ncbi:MAG: HD domain-containing protein [Candidatus Woesearchaeota archaeon]
MDAEIKNKLMEEAKKRISNHDPSHDISHTLRVLANAEHIAEKEGGNLDIIVPAALFHDIVIYPKNAPNADDAAEESAKVARAILQSIAEYPKEKIAEVERAIGEHSYSKGIKPKSKESKILQDADRLDATGAIAIMRTFASSGQMKRPLYSPKDPFCKKREVDSKNYGVDLFFTRLLKVHKDMNTETATKMAEGRTKFLHSFLRQLGEEVGISYYPAD